MSLTFSISLWRQTGERSQSADWTLGGGGVGVVGAGCLRLLSGCAGAAGLDASFTYKHTHHTAASGLQDYKIPHYKPNYSYPECFMALCNHHVFFFFFFGFVLVIKGACRDL